MKKRPTSKQLIALQKLWFIFGNSGKNHTDGNHKIIQHLLEDQRDSIVILEEDVNFYGGNITDECLSRVMRILLSNR